MSRTHQAGLATGKHKSVRPTAFRVRAGTHRDTSTRHRRRLVLVVLVPVAAMVAVTGAAESPDQSDASRASRGQVPPPASAAASIVAPSVEPLAAPTRAPLEGARQPARSLDTAAAPTKRPASREASPTLPPLIPETGSGHLIVAPGLSPVIGTGSLTTYTVEVERGLPLPVRTLADTVDEVLADARGWTATGSHGLQRTNGTSDLRVLITTPTTTDELCAPLITGGRLSCRVGSLVVLNAWRWVNGAASYGKDLRSYRRYLINHEVGHALGNSHETCPGDGRLAPVMMQQTKGVDACAPNPWPYPE